jgi:hypothetical protein
MKNVFGILASLAFTITSAHATPVTNFLACTHDRISPSSEGNVEAIYALKSNRGDWVVTYSSKNFWGSLHWSSVERITGDIKIHQVENYDLENVNFYNSIFSLQAERGFMYEWNQPAGAIVGEVNIDGDTSRLMICDFENLEWRLNYETEFGTKESAAALRALIQNAK